MTRSRRRGRRAARSGFGALFYVLGAAVAICGLAAAAYVMNRTAADAAIDAATLCPAKGPVAMTAVLFDLTDPLGPAQERQLRQYLDREVQAAAVGTQFTLGVVTDVVDGRATPALCKPPSGEDVSALTQNVAMIQDRYVARFVGPLQARVAEMTAATAAETSPIMESLQVLVASSEGFLTFAGPRRLILVTDLLQNSPAMSFYRGEVWDTFARSAAFARLGRTMVGVDVTIYRVPRDTKGRIDGTEVEHFWLRYFDLQGANLPTLHSLGDL